MHKYSAHHRIPRSRGGKRTVLVPDHFHKAWHILFSDLFDSEIVLFIELVNEHMRTHHKLTAEDIHWIRESCRK